MRSSDATGLSLDGSTRVSRRLAAVESSPVRDILALTERPEVISFAGGLPAPEMFPAEMLADAFATVAGSARAARSFQYTSTEGVPELRAALAARMAARGIPTEAEDVLVTTGSQQAISLISAALLDPGDVVLVEDPSYLAALQAFRLAGARLAPAPCDEHGLDPDGLAHAIAEFRPKLLYCIPSFQNPTGRTLSAERRLGLARVTAEHGLWLVEDDPYGELRYGGEPVAPIAALPEAREHTIAVSSLSKILAPGLRVGWMRAPTGVMRPLVIAKQAADLHTSTVDQLAAAHCLAQPELEAHVQRIRDVYRTRRDALLDGLAGALAPGSSFNRPDGGMFVWARLPEGHDATALLRDALAHDVAFVPGAPFFAGEPDERTLRLSFTTHTPAEIAQGLARLHAAIGAREVVGG